MPYDVECLRYNFFKDYAEKENLRFHSIRSGRRANRKSILYTPSGAIMYKLDFDDEYRECPRTIAPYNNKLVLKPLHTSNIKITQGKWNHLQSLKLVIHIKYHSFYDNLKYIKNESSIKITKSSGKRVKN